MTLFQDTHFTDLKMVPGEDPMELSTDMEKRFLGDEDIDIDLSLDGRSPYAQEDDDMLEDSHFAEDQRLCDDQRECNDDEMADVTEATDDMDKIQEGRHGENAQDLDEFDILVDDEEIEDVEDTVIFSDDTTGLPSTFPYQVGEVLEQQRHNQFSEQSYSNHANGTYGEVPHPNEIESQSVDFMQAYVAESAQDTRIFTTAEQADPTGHRTAMPDQKFFQEQVNPSQMAEDDFVGNSTDTILEDVSTVQALVSVQEEVEGEHERHDDRSNGSSSHNQLQGSSSDRASRDREELPEQTLPKDPSDSDPQIGVQSQKEEAFHHIPDANGTETVAIDTAVEVLAEQGKDSAPQETSSIHDRTLLHPVIVVYQESEILLFPPHEHGEDQAQTYFLKDESLATQTIESLLGACRLVLADSIDDDDELELKFTSLGLDICEVSFLFLLRQQSSVLILSQTSNAAITTTLAQILDIYLKLQHNDGLDYPDPLQMTLTTKLSFSHRFEYLHSAAAGGVGFLDVAQSSKAKYKYMEEHEDGNEYGGDDPQEKAESFRSDVDEAIEEGDRLTGAHDGVVTDFQTPDAGTKYSEELNLAEPVLEPTSHDHTLNEEGRQPQIEKVPRPDNTGQGINTQLQQDEINTIGDPVHHSFEHTEPFQDDFAARIENKDRGEGNRAFSPSSSTLRGDESDVAGGKLLL